MIRASCIGLSLMLMSPLVSAEHHAGLGLTGGDLARLGVVLEAPSRVTEIERVSAPAAVVIPPAQEAIVSTTVGGVITRLLVAEGDYVTSGETLAEISSSELLELEQQYVESALAADLARGQLERDRRLHADGIIAERRIRESEAAERQATTALDQTRQQLSLAGLDAESIARLGASRDLIPTFGLKAPFAGFVIEQMSPLGAHVDALDPVYRIADLSKLWVELRLPQERAAGIVPGMRVVAESGGLSVEGSILRLGAVADPASQTVMVRAEIDNDGARLRPGQVLTARVLGSAEAGAVFSVPAAAIARQDGQAWLFASHGEDLTPVPVRVVGDDGRNSYVEADLAADAEIAVAGIAALKSIWVAGDEEE